MSIKDTVHLLLFSIKSQCCENVEVQYYTSMVNDMFSIMEVLWNLHDMFLSKWIRACYFIQVRSLKYFNFENWNFQKTYF